MERLQPAPDLRDLREELERLLDRHLEHVGDRLPLEAHLERLPVVAAPVARLTGHVDVGEEVHLDLDLPVALARLAAAAADVEREAARLVAAHLRLGRQRVQLADVREEVGVRRRVRARRAPDRRLVDVDHLVEAVDPLDRVVRTRLRPGLVEPVGERLVDDLVDERRLARPGDARDADELPDRELDVDVLQVVLARADHAEGAPVVLAARRHRDAALAREELPRDGAAVADHVTRRPLGDDLSPVLARPRPHVDEPVGRPHHLLVVLDDEHGVAEVAESLERPDQPPVVALVEPDRGLVEDVEHADELRPDLRREPEPLRLAAGERPCRAVEVEVADPDVVEERQPLADLLQDAPPDQHLGRTSDRARRRSRSAAVTDSWENAWIDLPPIVTARTSGLSRAPLQTGQGRIDMYSSMRSRCCEESVSR